MMREAALAAASEEPDPSSLAAGQRLRKHFSSEVAAWALTQVELRRRAAGTLERAGEMWFTRNGMEQATRSTVARWRAQRFRDFGVRRVWDIGCGIGSDAMAFAEAGLDVVAVDADPDTVEIASHNLALVGAPPARLAQAEELEVPRGDAVFLDPARRTARGRTWNVAEFTPPWQLVLDALASERYTCVKLGPGIPKELLPRDVEWSWVSDRGDVVEASLWNRGTGRSAWRMGVPPARVRGSEAQLPVGDLGRFLAEPDGAVIAAGLIAEAVVGNDAWLLSERVAYLSSDQPIGGGWVTNFAVLDVFPLDRRPLARFVREQEIGTLEIKKRAVDVDPAQLRKQLKPHGPNSATLILTPTLQGARAVLVRRVEESSAGLE